MTANYSALIEKFRKTQKLTQVEAASLLEIRQTSVSKWESGESTPSIENLVRLINVCEDEGLRAEFTTALHEKLEFLIDPSALLAKIGTAKRTQLLRRLGELEMKADEIAREIARVKQELRA